MNYKTPSFVSDTNDFLNSRKNGNTTTFADNMKLPVHRWYRYSAGYSAEWAQNLIKYWDVKTVLDPFGGSGTTCLAAQEANVSSIGMEVHPTVARIANAKLNWTQDVDDYRNAVRRVLQESDNVQEVNFPSSPLFEKCFPDREEAFKLLQIRDTVQKIDVPPSQRELLWLTFVSIIRACSPAGTAQWQYILPNKTKTRVATPRVAFEAAGKTFAQDMESRQMMLGHPASAQVINGDSRTMTGVEDDYADAIITSPPYANNYDYADTLRLELITLGEIEGWSDLRGLRDSLVRSATQNLGRWNPEEALESSLLQPILDEFMVVYRELDEVRKNRGGNKKYHAMLAGYFYDNAQIFNALRLKSKQGTKVCYVVGDSAPYGVHAPVEKWLGELAVNAGFESWSFSKVRDRNTKWKNRKHTHPLHEGYLWIEG